jgi:hypothetical protein
VTVFVVLFALINIVARLFLSHVMRFGGAVATAFVLTAVVMAILSYLWPAEVPRRFRWKFSLQNIGLSLLDATALLVLSFAFAKVILSPLAEEWQAYLLAHTVAVAMLAMANYRNSGMPGGLFRTRWGWLTVPILFTTFLLVLIRNTGVSAPFIDEFQFTDLYYYLARGQMPPLSHLMAAHNGHPYLLLYTIISLILLLGLKWKLLMYAQPLFLLAAFIAIVRAARLNLEKWRDFAVYTAIAACVITPRVWEDLYWGMQLSAQMCLAFSFFAFYGVSQYFSSKSGSSLAIALACAVLASLSAGQGLQVPAITAVAIFAAPSPRSRMHLLLTAAMLALATALTLVSFELSSHPGMGKGDLQFFAVAEHALRMLAHAFHDFDLTSTLALWLGGAVGLVTIYLGLRSLPAWRANIFHILCMLLGLSLIAVITVARVKANIIQPNASRYIPAVAPLAVGLILAARALDTKYILAGLITFSCIGLFTSIVTEWHVAPYRKATLQSLKVQTCEKGQSTDPWTTPDQMRDIQVLFCKKRPGSP